MKPAPWNYALLLTGLIAWSMPHANPGIEQATRDCVSSATTAMAIAVCETAAQKQWQARIRSNDQRLRSRLDGPTRELYLDAQKTWERYRDAEFEVIDATLGKRDDGLAQPLAQGAKTEMLRERAEQQETLLRSIARHRKR